MKNVDNFRPSLELEGLGLLPGEDFSEFEKSILVSE